MNEENQYNNKLVVTLQTYRMNIITNLQLLYKRGESI